MVIYHFDGFYILRNGSKIKLFKKVFGRYSRVLKSFDTVEAARDYMA